MVFRLRLRSQFGDESKGYERQLLETNNLTLQRNGHPCLPAGRLTLTF